MKNDDKLFSLLPLEMLEKGALDQIENVLSFDFVKKLAIMPDCHEGYTLPIGGVALCEGVISPEFVGVDIGCGVCCVVTDMPASKLRTTNKKQKIFDKIYATIPVGFNQHKEPQEYPLGNIRAYDYNHLVPAKQQLSRQQFESKIQHQLGTLGSGNHANEIGKTGWEDKVSIMIHSGSRNPGLQMANFYIALSKVVDKDLPDGFLRVDSEYGLSYLNDMNYCLEFALANRRRMMRDTLRILGLDDEIYLKRLINKNHNHAIIREDGLILHRKGAISAAAGEAGVIPMNMRDGVFITEGLGNEEYLCSASHGAGRRMSRKKAKENIPLDIFQKDMKGIIARTDKDVLDESPRAYKDANMVMEYQDGKVITIIDHCTPLINIKG